MNSWQIWRQAILQVAASTAEPLEAKVIKLFFYEVGFILDLELNKIRLLCSSEYAVRSFAPYSWRCFEEVKALLHNPSLGYSLEVVSSKELSLLRASGKLPSPDFLAGISLQSDAAPQQPEAERYPKVDPVVSASVLASPARPVRPAAGLSPSLGTATFPQVIPQGITPGLSGASAHGLELGVTPDHAITSDFAADHTAAGVGPLEPSSVPTQVAPAAISGAYAAPVDQAAPAVATDPFSAGYAPAHCEAPLYPEGADAGAAARIDACAYEGAAVAAAAAGAAGAPAYDFQPQAQGSFAATESGFNPIQMQSAAAFDTKTGDCASLRLADNSSAYEEHDSLREELKHLSWVTAPKPSNCASGLVFSEPTQHDAAIKQGNDRQYLIPSVGAAAQASAAVPAATYAATSTATSAAGAHGDEPVRDHAAAPIAPQYDSEYVTSRQPANSPSAQATTVLAPYHVASDGAAAHATNTANAALVASVAHAATRAAGLPPLPQALRSRKPQVQSPLAQASAQVSAQASEQLSAPPSAQHAAQSVLAGVTATLAADREYRLIKEDEASDALLVQPRSSALIDPIVRSGRDDLLDETVLSNDPRLLEPGLGFEPAHNDSYEHNQINNADLDDLDDDYLAAYAMQDDCGSFGRRALALFGNAQSFVMARYSPRKGARVANDAANFDNEYPEPPRQVQPVIDPSLPQEGVFVPEMDPEDVRLEDSLGVNLPVASLVLSPEETPYFGTAAKSNQNSEALAARIHNMMLTPRPDQSDVSWYNDWFELGRFQTQCVLAAQYRAKQQAQWEQEQGLAPSHPMPQPPAPIYQDPEVEVISAAEYYSGNYQSPYRDPGEDNLTPIAAPKAPQVEAAPKPYVAPQPAVAAPQPAEAVQPGVAAPAPSAVAPAPQSQVVAPKVVPEAQPEAQALAQSVAPAPQPAPPQARVQLNLQLQAQSHRAAPGVMSQLTADPAAMPQVAPAVAPEVAPAVVAPVEPSVLPPLYQPHARVAYPSQVPAQSLVEPVVESVAAPEPVVAVHPAAPAPVAPAPQAEVAPVAPVAPVASVAPAVTVPQSVQEITRCEELAEEILKPTHASDLVAAALQQRAQRDNAARSASIAALPQNVSGSMASVYAAAAKRKRNCSSLPQPNALLSQNKVATTTSNPDEPAVLPAPDLLRQVEQGPQGAGLGLLPDDGSRHQLNLDNFKLSPEQLESSRKLDQTLAEEYRRVAAQRAAYKARQHELAKTRQQAQKRKNGPELLERFDGRMPGMDLPTPDPLMPHMPQMGTMLPGSPFNASLDSSSYHAAYGGAYGNSYGAPYNAAQPDPEHPELILSVPMVEVNPVKTFSTYVSDPRNFEILNAASLLSKYVGVPQLNPFLVYGDSGVGKTHILHAIANAIAYHHPDYKVAFIRAEEFLQNYVSSISESGKNRFADSQIYFQQAFLQYDVLIFDDIQALAKGVKSRQVFFEVIAAFLDRPGTQLIVAANTLPRELKDKGFDSSLLSRMGSGLCMPLMKPNWSNRRDIVNAKCQEMGITMSEDIVDYISINLNPNVREIEGALKTLHSFLNSNGSLTYDDAVRTLSGFIGAGAQHTLTISEIQATVAKEFGISVKDLLSSCKKKAISQARSLAMTIARDVIANNSLNDLGRAFKKDHTSVHEAIVRTRARLEADSALKEKYEHIVKALAELTRKP